MRKYTKTRHNKQAGADEVPAFEPGNRVNVVGGALVGSWGIVERAHTSIGGYYWVAINGSSTKANSRLLAENQLERANSSLLG